jgi:hypothetical protein
MAWPASPKPMKQNAGLVLGISRIHLRHCERSEPVGCREPGLLRRFAPRNDGLTAPEMTFLKPVRNVTFAKFFPPNTNDLEFA